MPYIEKMVSSNKTDVPINKRAYLLYHVAKQRINDPSIFTFLETGLKMHIENQRAGKKEVDDNIKGLDDMNFRMAFAAVVAYWRTNFGAAWALEFYEEWLFNLAGDLRAMEVVELCQAFRENRTHHRDHMRNILTNHLKGPLLKIWPSQVEYHQRRMF